MTTTPNQILLSREAELALFANFKAGDDAAMTTLVESYQPLVCKIAAGYRTTLDMRDRVQEGNLGLMEAIQRFDPTLGFRLSCYAEHWISRFISEAAIAARGPIRLNETALSKWLALKRTYQELAADGEHTDRFPSYEEVAAASGTTEEEIKLYEGLFDCALVRLEHNYHWKSAEPTAPKEERPDLVCEKQDQFAAVLSLLPKLAELERLAVTWAFGLNDEPELTQKEIGLKLGCSEWRARQHYLMGMLKLHRYLKAPPQ